jgi:hypothetical protein
MEKTAAQQFYEAQLREHRRPETRGRAQKQVEKRVRKQRPDQRPDDVDAWFEKHFHKAPVSHDTRLFNQLQGMKAALRCIQRPGAGGSPGRNEPITGPLVRVPAPRVTRGARHGVRPRRARRLPAHTMTRDPRP